MISYFKSGYSNHSGIALFIYSISGSIIKDITVFSPYYFHSWIYHSGTVIPNSGYNLMNLDLSVLA